MSGGTDALTRLGGAATTAGGTLILLSYFRPGALATSAWQQVPSRRRAVLVIRHLWIGAFIILVVGRLTNWIGTP